MKIIILLIKFSIKNFSRNIYWLYRLSKVTYGIQPNFSFPIIVEGRGKITFGDHTQVQKGVNLGVGDNGSLVVGNECKLEKDALIRVGVNKNFKIGHKFHLGHGVRLYVQDDWEFHNNTSIHSLCSISAREPGLAGKFIMHDNSHIGDNCIIDVSDDITIMENVAIGPNCTFYSHDHKYEDFSKAAWAGKTFTAQIFIGKNSWIGSNVTILPGVTIGSHVVVAAGSVVTKDLEDNSVYAGVPAKKMKTIE